MRNFFVFFSPSVFIVALRAASQGAAAHRGRRESRTREMIRKKQ